MTRSAKRSLIRNATQTAPPHLAVGRFSSSLSAGSTASVAMESTLSSTAGSSSSGVNQSYRGVHGIDIPEAWPQPAPAPPAWKTALEVSNVVGNIVGNVNYICVCGTSDKLTALF